MIRVNTTIEVPSPERKSKREIKRKCLKCGGRLFKENTTEDKYMDIESRFFNLLETPYYKCLNCGRIFEEKNINQEVVAA